MNKRQRKVIRDLSASKGLFLAVIAIIALGVAFYGATYGGYENLKSSYDYSYDLLGFADFTIKTAEDATAAVDTLQSIDGVDEVAARLNMDLALRLPGEVGKRVEGRVISLPSGDSRAAVNDVYLEKGKGSYFAEGQTDALLVEKNFADHHDLEPGETLYLTAGDNEVSFNIRGIVTSPEYILPAKSRQEILVSSETFGVVFVPEEAVANLLGEPFANEFCFLIEPGADDDSVITAVEEALNHDGYTVMDVVKQEEQPSYSATKMDLDELGEMAAFFPLLFVLVGALATYILLTRIVHNQRTQIGVMRALGCSSRQVVLHYLSFALLIGIAGTLLGAIAGYFLSNALTYFYSEVIGLPVTKIELQWAALGGGMFLGLLPCLIAGLLPAYAAARLNPAEAMRAAPLTTGRKLLIERLFPFLMHLSPIWKLPMRNIFRNRRRSLYTVIGVIFGVALILVSAGMIDSIEALLDTQFNDIQRYDAQVNFAEPQDRTTMLTEAQGWEGMEGTIEPVLQVPTRMSYGDKSYSTLAIGFTGDSELYGLASTSGGWTHVSENGILLSKGLQSELGIDEGDVINLQSPLGMYQLEVIGFTKDLLGSYGYVTLDQAQAMVGGDDVISGLMLTGKAENLETIRLQANQLPAVASVELTIETESRIHEMMDLLVVMMWVMLLFGAALALAIVFTTVSVNLLERRREIATMRTLGEDKSRIAVMLTIENLLLGLAGLLPGIVLGYALAVQMFSMFENDMMQFELNIAPRTYLLTAGLVMVIMLVSEIPALRQSNRLDLAKTIKEHES